MVKRFSIAALAAALTMSTFFSGTSLIAHAEELTQIQNPEEVDYGNYGADFSNEDIALLESMFDADYYALSNPDVLDIIKAQLGDSYTEEAAKALLFKHFSTCGLFEGRSLSANFNVMAFASAYSDLKDAFGKDLLSYYKYAATHDLAAEGRTITTVEAAAKAGITVTSVTNENVAITPQLYFVANALGVSNLQVVNNRVQGVMASSSSSNSSNNNQSGSQNSTSQTVVIEEENKTGEVAVVKEEENAEEAVDKPIENVDDTKVGEKETPSDTIVDNKDSEETPSSSDTTIPTTPSEEVKNIDSADIIDVENTDKDEFVKKYKIGSLNGDGQSVTFYVVKDSNDNYAIYTSSDFSGTPKSSTVGYNSNNAVSYMEGAFKETFISEVNSSSGEIVDGVSIASKIGTFDTREHKMVSTTYVEEGRTYNIAVAVKYNGSDSDWHVYYSDGSDDPVYSGSSAFKYQEWTSIGSDTTDDPVVPEDTDEDKNTNDVIDSTETTTQNTENNTDDSQNKVENAIQQNNETQSGSTADDTDNSNESGNNAESHNKDGE